MLHTAERAHLAQIRDRIDQAAAAQPAPATSVAEVQQPSQLTARRDAIASVVDSVVSDVCDTIDALQKQLAALKDQVLSSAASAKHTLNEHVEICARVRDETDGIRDLIDRIADKVLHDDQHRH